MISDQHAGLVKALRRCFQGVAHQRCRVHYARNLLAHVPKAQTDYVAAAFRTIFAQTKPADVHAAWDKTRDEFAARFPKLGPLMDDAKAEVLAFTSFPRAHWRNPYRRYQRTASKITSGRKRKPVNPQGNPTAGPDAKCASSSHPHTGPSALRQRNRATAGW